MGDAKPKEKIDQLLFVAIYLLFILGVGAQVQRLCRS